MENRERSPHRLRTQPGLGQRIQHWTFISVILLAQACGGFDPTADKTSGEMSPKNPEEYCPAEIGTPKYLDADCDGVPTEFDCDDSNPEKTWSSFTTWSWRSSESSP